MTDYKEEIKAALEDVPGLKSLSDSWPDTETELPAIVIDLASEKGADRRDDKRYMTELVYYVRIFADTSQEAQAIFVAVKPRMENLGYENVFKFDQNLAGAKQMVTRFLKNIPTV